MKIIESFIQGKQNNPFLCEDALLISSKGVAVIDGATSKTKNLNGSSTPGRQAAQLISSSLEEYMEIEDSFEMLCKISSLLPSASANLQPTASIILYQRKYSRIVNYGDCQCILEHNLHKHEKEIDRINSTRRQRILQTCLSMGLSQSFLLRHDIGRWFIMPSLKKQYKYANNTKSRLGYGVINGQKLDRHFMSIYTVHEGDEIVLASDGYPELQETYQESERILQRTLIHDPLIINRLYRSTKGLTPGNLSYDDRTYIRFIA